jgi:hypothetical protein
MATELGTFSLPTRDSDSKQILQGSALVNLAIAESGRDSLAAVAGNGYASATLAYEQYLNLLPGAARPDRNYVTFGEVADSMNAMLGVSWVDAQHIAKLTRTGKYDEHIYRFERGVVAWQYLQAAQAGTATGLIGKYAEMLIHPSVVKPKEFEVHRMKTLLRANFLFKLDEPIRRYFFQSTGNYLINAYHQAHPRKDHDFRQNLKRYYFPGFDLAPDSDSYAYNEKHYFPAALALSKRLLSDIINSSVEKLMFWDPEGILNRPSNLDLLVAKSYLLGETSAQASNRIGNLIYSAYDNPEDPDIAIIVPPPGVMGRWFSILTGTPLKPTRHNGNNSISEARA